MMGRLKHFGLLALLGVFLAMAFAGGAYFGDRHGVESTAMALDGIKALDNVTLVKMLERGDINAAMKYLDLQIDEDVIELDGYRRSFYLVTSLDREQRSRSLVVLKVIAKNRKDRPGRDSGSLAETDQRVQQILDAAVRDEAP